MYSHFLNLYLLVYPAVFSTDIGSDFKIIFQRDLLKLFKTNKRKQFSQKPRVGFLQKLFAATILKFLTKAYQQKNPRFNTSLLKKIFELCMKLLHRRMVEISNSTNHCIIQIIVEGQKRIIYDLSIICVLTISELLKLNCQCLSV